MRVRLLRVAAVTSALVIAAACGRSAASFHPSNQADEPARRRPRTSKSRGCRPTRARRASTLGSDRRPVVRDSSCRGRVTMRRACSAATASPTARCDSRRCTRWIRAANIASGSIRRVCQVRLVQARRHRRQRRTAGAHTTPSTVVARVYPTSDVVPENLLRMYIEFSGPMGRPSGIQHMKLLDEDGKEIPGAFLPLDYEFWSPDHTRFTAFFDPGRVKDGILPNQQMGRALTPGQSVTLVISREWRDQHGLPLKEDFRRVLRVGPADRAAARHRLVAHPAAARVGRRDGVVVTFPEPLDHGLLMRALGVSARRRAVDGDIASTRRRRGGRLRRASRGAPAPITCSRSTSWRTSPAIRSAARSRSTTSIPSTRAPTRRASRSRSQSEPPARITNSSDAGRVRQGAR